VVLAGFTAAVLGGTFNPIHLGHLHIAQYVKKVFELSQVHFVVAATPPHKAAEDLLSLTHRYAMVCLATQSIPEFTPSLVELEYPASPFSIDTLKKIAARSQGPVLFVAGGDSLREVSSWYRSEDLLAGYCFAFVQRPGYPQETGGEALSRTELLRICDLTGHFAGDARERIRQETGAGHRVFLLDAGAPDISSSQIRKLASAGASVCDLVPAPVHEYIRKLHLYGGQ
jgi:nicotinate-nucleotide adenylyltransferase